MKKFLSTLALLVATTVLLAQAPQKFTYQAVVRDAAGNLVRNAPVSVRASIVKTNADGVAVYCETHRQTSNANGLLTLVIGEGTIVGGDMAAIDWADGPYFLKTETDVTGGSNYALVGSQQLLSVPYALYAGNVADGFSGDYNDLSNKPTIPDAQVNADWDATEGVAQILNKPTKVSAFENDAKYLTEANLAARLDALQQQLDSLKEQIGEGGGSGHGGVGNDGKPCSGAATIMDVDSNIYNTVQIGAQCWMKENLKTTKYADGSDCQWYYPNKDASNKDNYGLLYSWEVAMHNSSSSNTSPSGVQGICPTGWHIPSDAEWSRLTDYVGNQNLYQCNFSSTNIAKALASKTGWASSSITCAVGNDPSSNNATGFSVLPAGGYRSGFESGINFNAYFWSSTEVNTSIAYMHCMGAGGETLYRDNYNGDKITAYSIRCLKDDEHTDGEACGTVQDADGNTYNTVQIGNQCWMKENLKTTKYADGTEIVPGSVTSSDEAYWYYPNNNPSNKAVYGLLYNWRAMMHTNSFSSNIPSGVQGICPIGWHIPSEPEWTQLFEYVSGRSKYQCNDNNEKIAKALASPWGWDSSSKDCAVGHNSETNNATGFSVLPAGSHIDVKEWWLHQTAYFWSASKALPDDFPDSYCTWFFQFYYDNSDVIKSCCERYCAISVRCLKD